MTKVCFKKCRGAQPAIHLFYNVLKFIPVIPKMRFKFQDIVH